MSLPSSRISLAWLSELSPGSCEGTARRRTPNSEATRKVTSSASAPYPAEKAAMIAQPAEIDCKRSRRYRPANICAMSEANDPTCEISQSMTQRLSGPELSASWLFESRTLKEESVSNTYDQETIISTHSILTFGSRNHHVSTGPQTLRPVFRLSSAALDSQISPCSPRRWLETWQSRGADDRK
jgi:hypothetical protein